MRLMLLFIAFSFAEILPLVILYEKIDDSHTLRTNMYLITKIVDDYNEFLRNMNLEIVLEGVYDYSTFSVMTGYTGLVRFAGLDDIQGRLRVLKDHANNIVMLVGSVDNIDFPGYYVTDPCKSRIFLNILAEPEIFPVVANGIRKWMSNLLESEIDDPLDVGLEKKKVYLKQEILQKLQNCRSGGQRSEKYTKEMNIVNAVDGKKKTKIEKDNDIGSNNKLANTGQFLSTNKSSFTMPNKINRSMVPNQRYSRPLTLEGTKTSPEDNLEARKNENPVFQKGFSKTRNKVTPFGNSSSKNTFFHSFGRNYTTSSENNT